MLGRQVTIFNMFGFAVRVHASWLVIAVLITWTLAEGVFRQGELAFTSQARWIMGAVGAVGLFVSVILHELCHSLVARHYGLPMKGITLFIFGGVAEMSEEPPNAKTEFLIAVAGPLASVVIGAAFLGLEGLAQAGGLPLTIAAVLAWLGLINFVLAAFNMIPGFPLDGGRVLRSALWAWKHNLRWATRVASQVGSWFGFMLIALGVFAIINRDFIGGMWWFLIGLFIRYAAKQGYQQVLVRQTLQGEPVTKLMNANVVTAPPDISLQQLVDDYVYRYHYKMFPISSQGRQAGGPETVQSPQTDLSLSGLPVSLVGCVTTRQIQEVPREQWASVTVGQVAQPCSPQNTIDAHEDALNALTLMNRFDASRMMVVDNEKLVGIVSLKDLMKFMSLKMELEADGPDRQQT